jgi:hypothetical protein
MYGRKIKLMGPEALRLRNTALAMPSSNSKLQTHPLVREGATK